MTYTLFLLSFIIILAGCEFFTNGIEWVGKLLRLGEGAVGSILAAVGTALPETTIPLVALFFRTRHAQEISIGAILGAPLLLSTLAFFVTGLAVLAFAKRGRRTSEMRVNVGVLGRDLRFFFMLFTLAVVASFLPNRPLKITAAFALLILYALYVRRTLRDSRRQPRRGGMDRLHLQRKKLTPHPAFVYLQTGMGLLAITLGARLFVEELATLSIQWGISALTLSLILAPVATELPEKFNSITWVRKKKDTLAIGNISGAMVFQSSVVPALGLLATRWDIDRKTLVCCLIALLSTAFAWTDLTFRKRLSAYSLLVGGLFYIIYLWWIL